ncbi:MAG: peptidylprolyl isomerase, partial [Burkholderiales bacterium 34-67-9]
MKLLLTAVALAATLALPAYAQNLAIVNGKPVPTARLNTLVQQAERGGRTVDDAMRAQLREEAIMREIFAQEAERRGLRASPEFRAQVQLATQTLLIRELFADFQRKNPVTDAQVQAEYAKFAAANQGQEFRVRHILVETEAEARAILGE